MWTNKPSNFTGVVTDLVTDIVREVAIDGLNQVTLKSPVDTGRYRQNHQIGIGEKDSITSESTANIAVSRGTSRLQNLGPFPVVYISNALPYAQSLEDGSSQQAISGVYRPTFTALSAKYGRISK